MVVYIYFYIVMNNQHYTTLMRHFPVLATRYPLSFDKIFDKFFCNSKAKKK